MKSTRPVALAVLVAGIPEALRAERRWVDWRGDWDGKRWTKRPYQVSGALAKSDDRSTWTTFERALAAYRTGRFDGISFALGDGWVGIDVDDYAGHAWPCLDQLAGYRETSPGGQGIKIVGRGDRIGGQIDFAVNPPAFTTWERARFFTITGQDASGDPTADLSAFIDEWFPPAPQLSGTREGYRLAAEMSDDELLCQMIGGETNSDQILALWRGDTTAYGNDHSRADLALCCHLAWWTNFDADRVDRMFRQSGLYRPKWDQASYRRATLSKAI